jgi:hypothetical protein
MNKLLKIVVVILLSWMPILHAETVIKIARGSECSSYMAILTALRLNTFKEFPYLYVGNENYEQIYSSGFPNNPDTLFATAYIDDEFAGILTGTPFDAILENEPEAKVAWADSNDDLSKYYYYGEAIVLEKFRKSKVAFQLSSLLEKEIQDLGYQTVCFITVDRDHDHPLQPENYQSIELYLPKHGYVKTHRKSDYCWPTLDVSGNVEISLNTVSWWVKTL